VLAVIEVERDVSPQWIEKSREVLQPFHDLLSREGVLRGLIGPREVDRLWGRHLLNCAAPADPDIGCLPPGVSVLDIGTGAGLPGLVWALVRPDLDVVLVEPLQRRQVFLTEAVEGLGLSGRVEIKAGRIQDFPTLRAHTVTSRALAALDEVLRWSIPHVTSGGQLLAFKGGRASQEVQHARDTMKQMDTKVEILRFGPVQADGHPWATIVAITSRSEPREPRR